MKVEFSKEDLTKIITDHLSNQGFSMRGRTLDLTTKTKFLGKGMGSDVTVVATVKEDPEAKEPKKSTPTRISFGDEDV